MEQGSRLQTELSLECLGYSMICSKALFWSIQNNPKVIEVAEELEYILVIFDSLCQGFLLVMGNNLNYDGRVDKKEEQTG